MFQGQGVDDEAATVRTAQKGDFKGRERHHTLRAVGRMGIVAGEVLVTLALNTGQGN